MGKIADVINGFFKSVAATVQKLSAFMFIVFAAGAFFGTHAAATGSADKIFMVITLPLLLALLSFLSIEFAVLSFLLVALILLL